MADHTPGPWKAVYVGCSDWDLDGPTTQEDWTLAAAAPDLLEALQEALVAMESDWRMIDSEWGPTMGEFGDLESAVRHYHPSADAIRSARAAIAKATGE